MTDKFNQIIEKEREECKRLRLKAMEVERDYSTLVTEITSHIKMEAKSHADDYLQISKQSFDQEKLEIKEKLTELEY